MRLSALLMLLRNKIFVPTISELRNGDPIEARILSAKTRAYFEDLSEPERVWLSQRANERERAIINCPETTSSQLAQIFVRIWDRELSERRRIWCWHRADIESMALWHIYGREGVAVQTSPGRIKRAFSPILSTQH